MHHMETHRRGVGTSGVEHRQQRNPRRETNVLEVRNEQSFSQDIVKIRMENTFAGISPDEVVRTLAVAFARRNQVAPKDRENWIISLG